MTGESDLVERLRRAYAAASEAPLPGVACPDPTRIWDAVTGALASAEARELVDHGATCPACGEAWRLARELAAEALPARAADRSANLGFRPLGEGRWRWLAAAAVALAVLVPSLLHRQQPPGPVWRGEQGFEIRPLLPEGQALPRDRFALRWSPGPAGTRYTLRVATGELAVIFERRALESNRLLVPPEALSGLPAGAQVLWQVEAYLPDGARATSRTFISRVR